MSLRVAFDLDGTVADMQWALRREAVRLFGAADADDEASSFHAESASPATESTEALTLTPRQQIRLWDHVSRVDNFWTTLPEMEPGIIQRIARTANERRWEVLFITTRPPTAGEPTQSQSQRWLDAHGFPFPSVYVVQGSRGRLASALHLHAVVDDRPENCLDVAVDSTAKPILVWSGAMEDIPGGALQVGVQPVCTIGEAVTLLEQFDDSRHASVARTIRRVFRRKVKAGR